MANIAKRPDGSWRARYRDTAGKEHSKHFSRKIDAQRWLDSVTAAVETGTYVDPVRARMTIGEWADRWLATKGNIKETTRFGYEALLRTHILPAWGDVQLAAITHERVAAWVAALRTELSASWTRQAHGVLSQMLSLAVRDGRLARNPANGVPLPRPAKPDKRYLSHEDVEALANASGEYRVVILFLAYTCLRYGEMAGLRVGKLDLLRRRATISEAVAEVNGRAVFSTPKTHQVRTVPIPRFLVRDLAEIVEGKAPDDLVFTSPEGGLLRLSNFRRKVFDPAATEAGLDRLTVHELRHTAASLAVSSGASVKAIQTMLGHASAAMTLDVYSHLFADELEDVADKMDQERTARRLSADSLRTNGKLINLSRSTHGPTAQ